MERFSVTEVHERKAIQEQQKSHLNIFVVCKDYQNIQSSSDEEIQVILHSAWPYFDWRNK